MRRRDLVALAGAAAVAACGGERWFGADDPPPLPGERRPVLLLADALGADPRLAALEVRVPSPRPLADWPQLGGNAAHALHHVEGASELREAWRRDVGTGLSRRSFIVGPPVVAGNRVLAADAAGRIAAFDAAGGRQLWSYTQSRRQRGDRLFGAGLAIDGGRVIAAFGHGDVAALGLDSGELIWEGRIPAPLRSPPSVAEGRVLLRTADNQLFALDGDDGAVLWRHAGFFEPTGFLGGAPPAVAAGTAVVAYSSGEVFALQLADGRPLWSETVQRPRRTLAIDAIVDVSGAPVIDAERVYVAGQGGETAAIELLRGIRAWDAPLSSPQMPWIAGDFLFLVTDRGDLVCLLRQGGRIRWVTRLGEVRAPGSVAGAVIWAGPILVGGRLLLASTTGQLISVLPETGEIVATMRLPGPAARPPVAAGGRVFVLTDRAQLVALG